jgi:large-conductance mechanosensitive channel
MITFLLEEGVLTVGALSGIFTATMLGSLKSNIIDPITEKFIPSHKLDKNKEDLVNINDANKKEYVPQDPKIKWQTFIRDLITWLIIMFILYLVWKFLIKKNKTN